MRAAGIRLTAAQVSQFNTRRHHVVAIVGGLVPWSRLWLWMARANGQGRNWARIMSTVLFGLATLDLASVFPQSGLPGSSRRCISVSSRCSARSSSC